MAGDFLAEALLPLLPVFEKTLGLVLAQPHRVDRERECRVPLRNATRIDRDTVRWLSRHRDAAHWLLANQSTGPEPLVMQREIVGDLDHAVNRHVCWMMNQVLARLDALHGELLRLVRRYQRGSLNDTAMWCDERARALAASIARLQAVWRSSSLRRLRPQRAAHAATTTVLLDHPAYARLAQLGRRIASPKFSLERSGDPDEMPAAVRPSFDLYELWTFLWVHQSIDRCLPPGWSWHKGDLSPLRAVEETGRGAYLAARSGDGRQTVEIRFNQPFSTVPGQLEQVLLGRTPQKPLPLYHSLSIKRRPDIVVIGRSTATSDASWVCLDAKYYQPGGLGRAMEKLHIYRDSLRLGAGSIPCRAGLILAPKCDRGIWKQPAFRVRFAMGVWEAEPGAAPSPELGNWLASKLGAW